MELIESAKNNNLDNEKIKELIRPLQDVLKLQHWLQHGNNSQELVEEMVCIDNPEGKHAEYNLYDPNNPNLYIGVSKLCCGYCHFELGPNVQNHRGTHGVCDDSWKPNTRRMAIQNDESFSLNEIPEDSEIFQHRRLSNDDCEKYVVTATNNVENNNHSVPSNEHLLDFKINLGVTDDNDNSNDSNLLGEHYN